jgi:hypothetical protein
MMSRADQPAAFKKQRKQKLGNGKLGNGNDTKKEPSPNVDEDDEHIKQESSGSVVGEDEDSGELVSHPRRSSWMYADLRMTILSKSPTLPPHLDQLTTAILLSPMSRKGLSRSRIPTLNTTSSLSRGPRRSKLRMWIDME